jgi:hypothetical protein
VFFLTFNLELASSSKQDVEEQCQWQAPMGQGLEPC